MKIGLYLQDYRKNSSAVFYNALAAVSKAEVDLLVFPEFGYTPFGDVYFNGDSTNLSYEKTRCEKTLEISNKAKCAVIVGGEDKFGLIFNVYANAFAEKDETKTYTYYKNTAAFDSHLGDDNFEQLIPQMFERVRIKGKNIGMTICYDCNHAAFSRAYKKNGIDILVNSTGGNVVYPKWYRYNKVRALENECFNFCTMGYHDNGKENSYTFGFTPNGKLMDGKPLLQGSAIGNIIIYDTGVAKHGFENDISLDQKETSNDKGYKIDPLKMDALLASAKKVDNNLYSKSIKGINLIFCVVNGQDITKPEIVLRELYSEKLKNIPAKKYLVVNRWGKMDTTYFNTVLSDIFKVRSMENFCAVLVLGENFSKCYQCGDNRTVQVVASVGGIYTLDLNRMGGPEVIWRNKEGRMKAAWRKGYESLIRYIEN